MTPLLDTHQHLIYPDRAGYQWTDDIPELAHRAFDLAQYRDLTRDAGIGGSIFMEAGVDDADYQHETRFVAHLAADPANAILGLIASCRPETATGYDAWLDECAELPVLGFRRILHVVDDEMSRSATFRANVRKLGARDLSFDMCFLARQLPIALELARACDNTRLILNHCGVPDIAAGGLESWRRDIATLAALPNVFCKVSGVMAYCAPGTASLETVRPYLDHVLACFGADRLVWGSDWPVVNIGGGIGGWLAATRTFLDELSEDESNAIAHGTAQTAYRL